MANQHSGPTFGEFAKLGEEFVFRLGIHRARWFVKHNDLGIPHECACQSYFLPFPNADFFAVFEPFAEDGVVSVRKSRYEVIGSGLPSRGSDASSVRG